MIKNNICIQLRFKYFKEINQDYDNKLNYIDDNPNKKKEDVKSFTTELEDQSDDKKTNRTQLEKVKTKKTQASQFENYMKDTGLSPAYQLIFTELLVKDIKEEDYFCYAASRLRQIGRDVEEVKNKGYIINI